MSDESFIINARESVIGTSDALFARCPKCTAYLNWRHKGKGFGVIATCCAYIFDGAFLLRGRIKINVIDSDMSNVAQLSVVDNGKR